MTMSIPKGAPKGTQMPPATPLPEQVLPTTPPPASDVKLNGPRKDRFSERKPDPPVGSELPDPAVADLAATRRGRPPRELPGSEYPGVARPASKPQKE